MADDASVTRLRFGSRDALRVRFGSSPLWETIHALRVLHGYRSESIYSTWTAQHRHDLPAADLALMRALQPHLGWTPDFLSPPPTTSATPRFRAELGQVAATPLATVRQQLERCRTSASEPWDPTLEELCTDTGRALARLVDTLDRAWRVLVEPLWPAVERILGDDIAYRGAQLTYGGLESLVDDLHPQLLWQDDVLVVAMHDDDDRRLAGEGLLLMPSVFTWPYLAVMTDPGYPAMVVYPCRGAARLWTDPAPPPGRLGRLLGSGRAAVLSALDAPMSTVAIARERGLAPSTVNEHLSAMHSAGLVDRRRSGHEVRYRRTPLGQAVVEASAG